MWGSNSAALAMGMTAIVAGEDEEFTSSGGSAQLPLGD